MGDLFSIAASGIAATRSAMSVTSSNIANVDTEGYSRRDTVQTEIAGAETSPLIRGIDQQGVQVTEIRRAFDQLLAARSREAAGGLAAAQANAPYLRELETRLMTEGGGPLPQLEAFFDALTALAASPEDMGIRRVAVEAGKALAGGVADLGKGIEALRGAIAEDAGVALGKANDLLEGLAELQGSIAVQKDGAAKNPLLDRRDRMLKELSGLVDVSVRIDAGGLAELRLGADPNGPVILSGARAGHLVPGEPGRLVAQSWDPTQPERSRAITGGTLGGLASADAALRGVAQDVDAWAGAIARDLNLVHRGALDLAGEPGGDLLSLAGWSAEGLAANRGAAAASVTVTDAALMPEGPIELVRDAPAGLWRALGPDGAVLAEGNGRLGLPGLTVEIEGEAADGDRIRLTDTSGWAGHMSWLVETGARLAAAGALRVEAMPGNAGAGRLSAVPAPLPPADVPDLSALLADGAPVEFLSGGVVGRLPAGLASASLQALPRQAAQEFATLPGGMVEALTLDPAGTPIRFEAAGAMTPEAFAAALQEGTIRDADGRRLSELGLSLEAAEGRLTLAAAEGVSLPGATLDGTAGPVAGVLVSSEVPAAALSVFTRDGKQLSGPPLSAAEALALLTEANGFLPGASYGPAAGLADVTRVAAAGNSALTLGTDAPILTFTGAGPVPATAASLVTLDGDGLGGAGLTLPEGTSAARRAELIAAAFPVAVDAETAVELALPATGRLSLSLTGDTLTPRAITADLGAGGPAALAQAVNAQAAATGITAELSSDGARLVLRHAGGADIVLGGVAHELGGTVGLTRLGPDGAALAAPVTLGGGSADGARITGTLRLSQAGEMAASEDGVLRDGQRDAFLGGAITRSASQAGSAQALSFRGAGIAPGLAVTTPDGREIGFGPEAALGGLSGADQAAGLLAQMRAEAPASRLVGAPMAAPPPLGATLKLALGSEGYAIRMTAAGLQVDGPEPGRLSATIDAAGRLVVETVGGDLDGAALVLPPDAGAAERFGLGMADAPVTRLAGIAPESLPASFGIEIGGLRHDVTATAGGVSLPPGFPGSAGIDAATGGVVFEIDARAGAVRIPPEAGAAAAGFVTLGAAARIEGDRLTLTATDGRRLETRALASGSAQALTLADVPNEELLVVMTGPGALRLAGATEAAARPAVTPREIRVIDAATGRIGLFDPTTGTELASRTLDASGTATIGGYAVTLSGKLADGDRFAILPNGDGQGDGRGAEALAALARRDTGTDRGGFGALYAELVGELGAQVAAADRRIDTATARKESAERAETAVSGVDLDAEAARLLQQQQAYQANAQVLSVARQLFDTLLNAI